MTVNVSTCESEIDLSEVQLIVRSILAANAKYGVTAEEIRKQYYELTDMKFPAIGNMVNFMVNIKGVMCYVNSMGTLIYYLVESDKSQHILSMVQNQKSPKKQQSAKRQIHQTQIIRHSSVNDIHTSSNCDISCKIPLCNINNNNSNNDNSQTNTNNNTNNICFFKDNYQYNSQIFPHTRYDCRTRSFVDKLNNSWNSRNTGTSTIPWSWNHDQNFYENMFKEKGIAHLYDYQLLGDDFFLSMARMELGCKFKRDKILQSGLCISGLTIRRATKLVKTLPYICPNIIVNVGSVDILDGRELIDIEYDFRNLKRAFADRGITPIYTTLAPLGNFGHKDERVIIERFNDFLRRNIDLRLIDLWPCMVNEQGHTLYGCYQCDARYVTGSNKPHVFWNKLGRQRILKKIKSEIELMPF